MLTVVVELQEQLRIRERGLAGQESALMAREGDLVATEHALGRAHMECNIECDWAEAVW
jgi:gamma-glutamylcysteine synthetase